MLFRSPSHDDLWGYSFPGFVPHTNRGRVESTERYRFYYGPVVDRERRRIGVVRPIPPYSYPSVLRQKEETLDDSTSTVMNYTGPILD